MSLTPEDEDLLASARAGLEPTGEDQKRVRRAIAAQVALAASISTASATAGAGAAGASGTTVAAASGAGGLVKIVGGFALLLSLGVGAGVLVTTRPAPPAAPSAAEVTSSPLTSSPSSPSSPSEPPPTVVASVDVSPPPPEPVETKPPAKPSQPPNVRPGPSATGEGSLGAETRLVRDATSALQRGDGAAALAALDEHARKYPQGVLSEERDAQRVLALCALGRVAEAKSGAARFVVRHPSSALVSKVRGSCAGP
ncbi:MAG: hypothetical protein U0183_22745 [Polyangiaceae bacterium]